MQGPVADIPEDFGLTEIESDNKKAPVKPGLFYYLSLVQRSLHISATSITRTDCTRGIDAYGKGIRMGTSLYPCRLIIVSYMAI